MSRGGIYTLLSFGIMLCLFSVQVLCVNGVIIHADDAVDEAVEIAARAAQTNSGELFREAEIKLIKAIKIIEKKDEKDNPAVSKQLRSLRTLLYWNRILQENLEKKIDDTSSTENGNDNQTTTTPENDTQPGDEPDNNGERKNPVFSSEEINSRLKKLLQAVLVGYATDKEKPADEALGKFFNTGMKRYLPNSTRLVQWYRADKQKTLFKLYGSLASMKDKTVFYIPPKGERLLKGTLVDIRGDTVQIRSKTMTIGVPVLSLAAGTIINAGRKLETSDRILLGFYMYLKSRPVIGRKICPPLKKESELNELFVMIGQLIELKRQKEFFEPYNTIVAESEKYFEQHEYLKSLDEIMKLSVLSDSQLAVLNRNYQQKSGMALAGLLNKVMTTCGHCHGHYKVVCPKCKGSGKVLEKSQTTFFENSTIGMRLVKCNRCGGKGTVFCPHCVKRRFNKKALEFQERLKRILLATNEAKGETDDRPADSDSE